MKLLRVSLNICILSLLKKTNHLGGSLGKLKLPNVNTNMSRGIQFSVNAEMYHVSLGQKVLVPPGGQGKIGRALGFVRKVGVGPPSHPLQTDKGLPMFSRSAPKWTRQLFSRFCDASELSQAHLAATNKALKNGRSAPKKEGFADCPEAQ